MTTARTPPKVNRIASVIRCPVIMVSPLSHRGFAYGFFSHAVGLVRGPLGDHLVVLGGTVAVHQGVGVGDAQGDRRRYISSQVQNFSRCLSWAGVRLMVGVRFTVRTVPFRVCLAVIPLLSWWLAPIIMCPVLPVASVIIPGALTTAHILLGLPLSGRCGGGRWPRQCRPGGPRIPGGFLPLGWWF